ncbi:MAG TPA: Os1348 family NHLP clan protein [Candidatus Limnocylindria bacterium]|nr:Os1348 family NHLP clan protein [Candidatus Limnocylindria bacterium]
MSKEALTTVVQRAISDGAFRRQLASDPTKALRGFELTPNEVAALRSGDSGRISALGVDVRMSKAFTLAGGESVSNVVSSDLGASHTGVMTPADVTSGESSLSPGDGAGGRAPIVTTGGDGAGQQVVQWDGHDDEPLGGRNEAVIPGNPAHAFEARTAGDGPMASTDETDQYLPQINTAQTAGESAAQGALTVEPGASGAQTPGEASEGPNIQP